MDQIRTVDKSRLVKLLGKIEKETALNVLATLELKKVEDQRRELVEAYLKGTVTIKAVSDFIQKYNEQWLLEKLGYHSPLEVRELCCW